MSTMRCSRYPSALGQDWGFGNRLDVARKFQFAFGRGASDVDYFHTRNRLLLVLCFRINHGFAFL